MKSFSIILAALAGLAVAEAVLRRQDSQATDAQRALNLRAEFCLIKEKKGCIGAALTCENDIHTWDCFQKIDASCIQDESSVCSKAVLDCLKEGSDEDVKNCIVAEEIDTIEGTDGNQSPDASGGSNNSTIMQEVDQIIGILQDSLKAWMDIKAGGAIPDTAAES